MKIVKSPNRWSCLPCSFATILQTPLEDILQFVGHDGSELYWKHLPEPKCRKGFHIQEMIDFAWSKGFAVTPFEPVPTSVSELGEEPRTVKFAAGNESRISKIMDGQKGVLTGLIHGKISHAIGWHDGIIYDPSVNISTLEDFGLQCFWLLTEIKS